MDSHLLIDQFQYYDFMLNVVCSEDPGVGLNGKQTTPEVGTLLKGQQGALVGF